MDSGGAAMASKRIEIVGFRSGATSRERIDLPPKPPAAAPGGAKRIRIHESREERDCSVTTRPALEASGGASGPLLVEDETATIYIPPGWRARVDAAGNLIAEAA